MTDPAPLPDNGVTQTDSKPWSRERPFQRLNSPSFDFQDTPLDGNAHVRGTRRLEDMPLVFSGLDGFLNVLINRVFEQGARMAPNWARTMGPLEKSNAAEHVAEHEVYGKLLRSFQTWTDVPGFQWHRWYDWNFHVQPVKAHDWLRGAANRVHIGKPEQKKGEPPLDQFVEGAVECEWDAGSIGRKPGPMFTDLTGGKSSNWIWPMTGDWFWASGRSIYDGGHEFREKKKDPTNPQSPEVEVGPKLGRSELHPIKAMAAIRREAVFFAGSKHRVPVTQFVFFASTLGGYIDFDSLAPEKEDYTFVVDLPLRPDEFQPLTHTIGRTPEFPLNRLALRWIEPAFEVDFETYKDATGAIDPQTLKAKFSPRVEFKQPDASKPNQWQAVITIPLKALAKQTKARSYGVVVNVGWPDPYGSQGKRVKRCLVTFKRFHSVTNITQGSTENWRVKIAVNRRWFHFEQKDVKDEIEFTFVPRGRQAPLKVKHRNPTRATDLPTLPPAVELFLPEDEQVEVHVHAWQLNAVDKIYLRKDSARTVMFNRIQIYAEAIRTGEDPGTALKGDTLSDVAAAIASLPLAVLEMIETIPVIGTIVQFIESILSLIPFVKPSPTHLLGLIGERPADWREHIDVQPPKPEPRGSFVVQRVVVRNAILMMADSFGVENEPLAIIDAGHGFGDENKKNPLPVKTNGLHEVRLSGLALRSDEKLAELFEFERGASASSVNRDFIRYEVDYTVDVSNQKVEEFSPA